MHVSLLVSRSSLIRDIAVWPSGEHDSQSEALTSYEAERSPVIGPQPLYEKSIAVLVDSILEPDRDFDSALLDEPRKIPRFQGIFRRQLLKHSPRLHQSRVALELLHIAFAGQQHLDWVSFDQLPTDVISAALASEDLKDAKSISLCIDTVQGTPAQLVKALSHASATLTEYYFHQQPSRQSDEASTQLFIQLSTLQPGLLHNSTKLMLSGSFSASLRRKMWLPTPDSFIPPFSAFPVQHMFVRLPLYHDGNDRDPNRFWPRYHYLADALLRPERFATCFLAFLAAIVNPWIRVSSIEELGFMSCAAPTLADLIIGPDLAGRRRFEISPLPAENLAIPLLPSRAAPRSTAIHAECWPRVRSLVPGSWTVLVSVEEITNTKAVRYAFVRPLVPIGPGIVLGPREVEVVGSLGGFLRNTAPGVDASVVEQRLADLETWVAGIDEWRRPITPESGHRWVSVMEEDEARAILAEFLQDAATFGRSILRMAMEERPGR